MFRTLLYVGMMYYVISFGTVADRGLFRCYQRSHGILKFYIYVKIFLCSFQFKLTLGTYTRIFPLEHDKFCTVSSPTSSLGFCARKIFLYE